MEQPASSPTGEPLDDFLVTRMRPEVEISVTFEVSVTFMRSQWLLVLEWLLFGWVEVISDHPFSHVPLNFLSFQLFTQFYNNQPPLEKSGLCTSLSLNYCVIVADPFRVRISVLADTDRTYLFVDKSCATPSKFASKIRTAYMTTSKSSKKADILASYERVVKTPVVHFKFRINPRVNITIAQKSVLAGPKQTFAN